MTKAAAPQTADNNAHLSGAIGRLVSRLLFLTGISMSIAAALSLVVAMIQFDRGLRPLILAQVETATQATSQEVLRALDFGIPLDAIGGLDAFLVSQADAAPAVSAFILTAPDAPAPAAAGVGDDLMTRLSAASSRVGGGDPLPLIISRSLTGSDGRTQAVLHSVIDRSYVSALFLDILFDGFVIYVAGILIALELVSSLVWTGLGDPLRSAGTVIGARARGDLGVVPRIRRPRPVSALMAALAKRSNILRKRAVARGEQALELVQTHALDRLKPIALLTVTDARVPLFVFSFGEELQKSFLPLYVSELWRPDDLFDQAVMTGLPISVFMFVVAVITPFAATLVDKFGNRRLFLAGLIPAMAGYVVCAMAVSGDHVVLGRAVTALGYGIITISAQSYIALAAPPGQRARAMATFVGVLMVGTMCGTAIGGILAEWLGFRAVFWIACGIAGAAGLLGLAMLRHATPPATATTVKPAGTMALWRNPRFVALILLCAIPTKIVLTGILYLYVPLYLASLDASQSEIGRIMMIYSLVIIPLSPLAAMQSDRLGLHVATVGVATVVSGVILLGLLGNPDALKALAVVTAIGVAHAFVKAPLIAGAMDAALLTPQVPVTAALGLLRTSERVGSVLGPLIVATLLIDLSFSTVAAIVGVMTAVAGLALLATTLRGGAGPAQQLT